jgi:hypothetical protein
MLSIEISAIDVDLLLLSFRLEGRWQRAQPQHLRTGNFLSRQSYKSGRRPQAMQRSFVAKAMTGEVPIRNSADGSALRSAATHFGR